MELNKSDSLISKGSRDKIKKPKLFNNKYYV